MTKTFIFDESSWKWDKDMDINRCILIQEFKRFMQSIEYRGYIYLNQLHEGLGMKWDPDIENVCFRRENGPVKFDYELTDFNTYRIIITQ